jgi:ribose 5-phosphate isomerase B
MENLSYKAGQFLVFCDKILMACLQVNRGKKFAGGKGIIIMEIAIGSDHGGIHLKEHIKTYLMKKGFVVEDYGTYSEESVDYPDYAEAVAKAIVAGKQELGILICGTGIGVSISANKIKGIRAALCGDCFSALMSREHNDANILCLGERVIGLGLAEKIVDTYLTGHFQGGRHARRVEKIMNLEK